MRPERSTDSSRPIREARSGRIQDESGVPKGRGCFSENRYIIQSLKWQYCDMGKAKLGHISGLVLGETFPRLLESATFRRPAMTR